MCVCVYTYVYICGHNNGHKHIYLVNPTIHTCVFACVCRCRRYFLCRCVLCACDLLIVSQEHQMYVAVLVLTRPDAAGSYAAISCSTNVVKATPLSKKQLSPGALSWLLSNGLWIVAAMLVLLLALVLAR